MQKIVPRVILKPRMRLDLFRPIQPQSIYRLSLERFINKIRRLQTPSLGHLMPFDLNLLRQNMVSDLLPRFSQVRPLAKHHLIAEHPNSEVVNGYSMVLSAHHLRGHIPRGATGIL